MPIYDFFFYKRMYLILFNAITDALRQLPEEHPAAAMLRQAQQRTEDIYTTMGADL